MGQECSPKPWLEEREKWIWMEMLMGSQSKAPLPWAGIGTHPQVTCVGCGTNLGTQKWGVFVNCH